MSKKAAPAEAVRSSTACRSGSQPRRPGSGIKSDSCLRRSSPTWRRQLGGTYQRLAAGGP